MLQGTVARAQASSPGLQATVHESCRWGRSRQRRPEDGADGRDPHRRHQRAGAGRQGDAPTMCGWIAPPWRPAWRCWRPAEMLRMGSSPSRGSGPAARCSCRSIARRWRCADPGHRGTAAGWMQSRSSSQDSDRGDHFATLRGTSGHAGFISTHCGCGCAPPPGPLLQQGQVSHKTGRRLAHDHAPTNVLRLNTSSEQRLGSPCWPRSTLKDQYSQLCGIAWLSSLITPTQRWRPPWDG